MVAFWYHAVSLLVAATALAAGWPEFPVLPGPAAAVGLFTIGVGSYLGQICWARAFQIGNAARMSAITYSEVPLPPKHSVVPGPFAVMSVTIFVAPAPVFRRPISISSFQHAVHDLMT